MVGVIAAAAGRTTVLLWGMAVAGVAAATAWWTRAAWRGVRVESSFAPHRAFLGEPVVLTVRLVNDKPVPLPLVNLGVWLPPGLFPVQGAEGAGAGYRGMWLPEDQEPGEVSAAIRGYRRRLSVAGRSEAVLELPVRVTRRGEFPVERIEVELSDPFGLAPVRRPFRPQADLLVMPDPRIAVPAGVRATLPFGAPARAARMFEERERFAGVRPYEPGDPMGRIHWRATAHAGDLQTKLFEPTRSADVLIALDLAVGEPFWDSVYPQIAEDTIAWGAFLAREAVSTGWRVGLAANTHLTRYRGALRVPPSSARGHEAMLFAALARMPNEPTADMAPVLHDLGRALGPQATVVLVSPRPGPALRHEVARLRRRGTQVVELSPLRVTPWEGGAR